MRSSINLFSSQAFQLLFGVNPRDDIPDVDATFQFVVGKLAQVLKGQPVEESPPPPLSIRCNHMNEVQNLIIARASITDTCF
jgi:hypothetical protein